MKTDNTDDLSQLDQLNNKIILNVLKKRYEKDVIYTNCGDILIALNPCKELPIFGENEHSQYDWVNFAELPAPHIFHTAARAFRRMRESETDQVIIVSGESGAGKTESTKFMVKHFVHMCRSDNKELHEKIIKVNPLLEAFGNAKTHMNHNSSRFAKYLELSFSETWDLTGVIIRDYMLEKSRVVHRSANEGNFHAFYSLFHGAPKENLKDLSLEKHASSYRIMQSDPDSLIAEARYREMYKEQTKVLQQIQTDPQVVDALLAAVIHLTEIKFTESSTVAGAADLTDLEQVVYASELLSLKAEDLVEALLSTKMTIRGDEIRRNKGPQQAAEGRDALAKMLYERTFQWLVRQINADLHPNRKGFGQLLSTSILDIAGFEMLPINSLEQLCINIVNERLQNFMNERLFRFELQTYTDEGIDVGNVAFENNDVLIAFLTKPRNSVLAILDEQSTLQQGSDNAFVRQLTEIYKDSGIYIPPVADRPEFTVRHFAGKVTYNAAGFMEKNRDLLSNELKDCMKSSQDDFISDLFTVKRGPTGTISATVYNYGKSRREMAVRVLPSGASKREQQFSDLRKSLSCFFKKKLEAPSGVVGLQQITSSKQHKTVVSHFKSSLLQLLDKMSRAEHFFVRCLKPNEDLRQNDFTDDVVSEQLKYNGISEMAKIRRMGFTYRRTYEEFVSRYNDIWPVTIQVQENCHKAAVTDMLKSGIIPAELQKDCRLGKTKVFMKERLVTWIEGVLYGVKKKKEEERRKKEEEERKKKEEEERLRREEVERRNREEMERRKREEVERRKREEEDRHKREEEERHRKEDELKIAKEAKEVERKSQEMESSIKSAEKREKKKGVTFQSIKESMNKSFRRSSSSSKSASVDNVDTTEPQTTLITKNWSKGDLIGSGGFGTVYKVADVETNEEQFAVKQIALCRSNETRKVMDSLKKDVTMLRSLENARIAKYYGSAEDNDVFYIFIEYAQNRSLEDFVKEKGPLEDTQALRFTRQVLEGLAFLHAAEIVHRDVKASNILLDGEMNVKLCDIGFSTTLETHTFASRGCTTSVGSSFWASPEVVKGDKYNVKTDIWSLGCTIIELLTGQRPWYPYPPYTALLRIGCDLCPLDAAQEQFTLSDNMKNFLDPMFQVDKKKRPSAQDLMSHSLYTEAG
ncbi:hypothetical protein CHS0354_040541 [Potamilus streckersoni]|uniref:Uncharacterized protein n=1 Tax=Potamilus streckersoni TaxID=2493646 RepID=A0AAE0W641_9BIVA|nr:hypothetical protein CHS0354_040541 [Potamilus streckersoni]